MRFAAPALAALGLALAAAPARAQSYSEPLVITSPSLVPVDGDPNYLETEFPFHAGDRVDFVGTAYARTVMAPVPWPPYTLPDTWGWVTVSTDGGATWNTVAFVNVTASDPATWEFTFTVAGAAGGTQTVLVALESYLYHFRSAAVSIDININ